MNVYLKRIYVAASETDGKRILVDRLWPRGIKKELAKIDLWAKEITPSNELRKWYHEDIDAHWDEFQQRYRTELASHASQVEELRKLALQHDITLITAAKNEGRSHISILKQVLENN